MFAIKIQEIKYKENQNYLSLQHFDAIMFHVYFSSHDCGFASLIFLLNDVSWEFLHDVLVLKQEFNWLYIILSYMG